MTPLQSSFFEADTLEEVNRLVMEKGWGDGLPVVPPTEERVLAMLAHTGDDPGRVMGEMPPLNGEATVEKVAINAVMAGCKPEYFPIVLAMVEAVLEPPFNMNGVATTTNPSAPVVIVNGPVRRDAVGINCGIGCFGPGTQANATIGRSLRLIMQTLGGAKAGAGSQGGAQPARALHLLLRRGRGADTVDAAARRARLRLRRYQHRDRRVGECVAVHHIGDPV